MPLTAAAGGLLRKPSVKKRLLCIFCAPEPCVACLLPRAHIHPTTPTDTPGIAHSHPIQQPKMQQAREHPLQLHAADPEYADAILKQQQQRLLYLRHASRCRPVDGQCPQGYPACQAMRDVWQHIASCRTQRCPVRSVPFLVCPACAACGVPPRRSGGTQPRRSLSGAVRGGERQTSDKTGVTQPRRSLRGGERQTSY